MIVSADIGGTFFRVGLVDGDGAVRRFRKIPTGSVLRGGSVLTELGTFFRDFIADQPVRAAAIAFPATLDAERKRVVQAPSVPALEDIPVVDGLSEFLGVPVLAERDATFALCRDMEKYGVPAAGITCGVYYGTGIGNAVFIDGRPLTGRSGAAGELGHIPVPGSTVPCGCGNVGCMEAVAGGKALVRLQRERYPDTPIGEMFSRHARDAAMREFIDCMAITAATEVNILDPDHLLLGGGVLNMPDFPREAFLERLLARVRGPLPRGALRPVFTGDEPDKSVVGGAIYARRRLRTPEG